MIRRTTACVFHALVIAALLGGCSLTAAAQTFSGAMTGSWWSESRSGEGQFITFETVGARNVAYLAYFTYDEAGAATWHVGNADYAPGAASIAIPLVTGSGARFGADFRAADVRIASAGTATLEYVSCRRMRMRHSAMPDLVLELTRLVGPLEGVGCTDPAPNRATADFAGLVSGSWWNAGRGGEGQFVTVETVNGRSVVYLAYFTYTSTGAATWLVGNADVLAGATRVQIPLVTGSGARFGAAFRPGDVRAAAAGTATLDFVNCGALRLSYSGTQSLTVDLLRLVGPLTGLPCTDATTPASATDLTLRALLSTHGIRGNARAGRPLPSIDEPLPQLGKLLFFSKTLGAGRDMACASCHHPSLGGGDGLSLSIGAGAVNADLLGPGRRLPSGRILMGRNANTFFNAGLLDSGHFWDSRIESLAKIAGRNGSQGGIRTPDSPLGIADARAGASLPAAQARFPLVKAAEMLGEGFAGVSGDEAIRAHIAARLGDYGAGQGLLAPSQWLAKFRAAFNSSAPAEQLITIENITLAIAEYERSAAFVDSRFARYARGDNGAMSEQAKRGALFFFRSTAEGGAQCAQCHRGETLSGETHHAIAFPQIGPGVGDDVGGTGDFGRGRETGNAAHRHQFRVPPLLNVALTGPWGHAGAYGTLDRTIEHYFTPDDTVNLFLSTRAWCTLPQFAGTDCAATAGDVSRNTLAALAKLKNEQATSPAESMPIISLLAVPRTAVADIGAFLHSLTDPCLEDRACFARWIPRPEEAPDGHQLNAVNAAGNPL